MSLILVFTLLSLVSPQCIHDQAMKGHTISFYDDVGEGRRLQNLPTGPLRVHVVTDHLDQKIELTKGKQPVFQQIKTVMKIGALFFSQLLKVPQSSSIKYNITTVTETQTETGTITEAKKITSCNAISIPKRFWSDSSDEGLDADIGVVVNAGSDTRKFIASCIPCQLLTSTRRPIWAAIQWNLGTLQGQFGKTFSTFEFQQLVFVAIHQLTHGLVFSNQLYQHYNSPDITVKNSGNSTFVRSAVLRNIIAKHFNCSDDGIQIEDNIQNDRSHWEKEHVGNQIMVGIRDKNSYFGEFTAALFEGSGWYPQINRELVEPSSWGKSKGCSFLKKETCQFEEYCEVSENDEFDCSWDSVGMGKCQQDKLTNKCRSIIINQQNVCLDRDYTKTKTNQASAAERSGPYSKCFKSDFRPMNQPSSRIKTRCYQALCLRNNKFVFIRINNRFFSCLVPGQIIPSIVVGFEGILECPKNFDRICSNKKTCPYSCGKTGVCVNGGCLCLGRTGFSSSCPFSNRRLLQQDTIERKMEKMRQTISCPYGQIFDPITKKCESCLQILSCSQCDSQGCIVCDDGSTPKNGQCL